MLTQRDIEDGLTALGLQPGAIVVVHSSLSSLGPVDGGANAVIDALVEVVGPGGTLMMPTHPARDGRTFDPDVIPSDMGVISETFRLRPGRDAQPAPLSSGGGVRRKGERDPVRSRTERGAGRAGDALRPPDHTRRKGVARRLRPGYDDAAAHGGSGTGPALSPRTGNEVRGRRRRGPRDDDSPVSGRASRGRVEVRSAVQDGGGHAGGYGRSGGVPSDRRSPGRGHHAARDVARPRLCAG